MNDKYALDFPETIYEKHLKNIQGIKFTPREAAIIAFILNGRQAKIKASVLEIATKTLANHTRNVMGKLKCNAKEQIIDFTEKSGTYSAFRQYYVSLLLLADFTKILKDIGASNTKASCTLVYWTPDLFMPRLLEHLLLTGIEITEDKRVSWYSLETLLYEPSYAPYTIYLLPQAAWEGANALPIHAPSTSKLFIFPTQTNPLTPSIDLSALPHLDLTGYDNYYLWVLELLKRLLPEQLLEKHISYFSARVAHLSNPIDSVQNSAMKSPNKPMRSPPPLTLATFASKRVYACLIALCLGLGGLTLYYYFRRSTEFPIRSELFMPVESVLLKRPELIAAMDQHFKNTSTHIQTLAITGVSGSGKTTLAREYARTQKIAVIWEINAQTEETFLISFKNLAYALAKTEGERKLVRGFDEIKNHEEKTKTLFAFVAEKLKTADNWLLIYDNAENGNKVMKYFPYDTKGMQGGKIIVTTRDSNIHLNNRIGQTICIPELSEHEKYDLFAKIMAIDAPQPFTAAEKESAKEFVSHLPPFPLDISAAAYYLKVTNTSYAHYLEHMNKPTDDFNEVQEEILGDTGDYTKSRYQIITMPLKKLLDSNQGFEKLLLFISLLDASSIPRDLLEELTDDVTLDKLIISLKQYSLVSSHNHPTIPNYLMYSLHRSTQTIWLAYLSKLLNSKNSPALFQAIFKAFLENAARSIETEDFERMKILIPHCEMLISHNKLLKSTPCPELQLVLGCLYFYSGNYKQAKHFLTIYREPPNSIWHLRALTYLGALYISLGDQETAKRLLTDTVKGYQDIAPQAHAVYAQALRYLAMAYRDAGDYKTAKDLFEKSLSLYQEHIHENHVGRARALGYVGDIYRELGNFEKARELLEQSYAIHKAYFPDNKLGIVWNLAHLGEVYGVWGDYDKARCVLEESLQICKDYLPETHAYYPWIAGCLGTVYCALGNYTQAK